MYQVLNVLSGLPAFETEDLATAKNFKNLMELIWGSQNNDAYIIVEKKGNLENEKHWEQK